MTTYPIIDLHNDVITSRPRHLMRVERDASVVCAAWTTELANPLEFLKRARQRVKLLAVEDLGFITDSTLHRLAEFKLVYASLTWNRPNALAGGAQSDEGLTPFGARVIEFLEKNNILFDTAHLNEKSFFDAMRWVKKPLICSHTCFNGVFNHPRNLSYGQIKVVVDGGGLIGLTLFSEFMGCKQAGPEDVIRQIDYFCSHFDYKSLAFGTDFYGCPATALEDYRALERLKWELVKRGYTHRQVEAIFFGNAARFIHI